VVLSLTDGWAVILSSLVWVGVSLLVGWRAARWADDRLDRTGPLTRLRPWEDHGRWWQRNLAVRRWKDAVPEAGAFFGGFAKRRLPSRSTGDLELFRRETVRAERVHWMIGASTPLHLLWCGPGVFAAMVAFGVVFNAPFIVIQRSNRGRLDRLIQRRQVRGRIPSADRPVDVAVGHR
jgi:glycosyl-4,4'-diaponeurosporenoate acyltransferase